MRKQRLGSGPKKRFEVVTDISTYDKLQRDADRRGVSKALIIGELLKEKYNGNAYSQ